MVLQVRIRTEVAISGLAKGTQAMSNAPQAGLLKAAQDGFNDSQRLVHVRTGNLKRSGSIKSQTSDKVTYGYDANYAGYEEFGTSRRPPHPYITPRYNILGNGLAADYVYQTLRTAF